MLRLPHTAPKDHTKPMENIAALGVIGGSGLYAMEGLSEVREHALETPFGLPSDPIISGMLSGQRVAFLARHGRGHRFNPSEVNYRANIYALKLLGVKRIVSISACGSLREDYAPGDIVIPDQLYDNTRQRERSFFGGGLVVHASVADPFAPQLSAALHTAASATSAHVHRGGSFITIEGPRFSTRAESEVFRKWGMSLVGMTTSPEAFLAREAEIAYAVLAHVTDYDVWHQTAEPVTVEMVIQTLLRCTGIAQQAVANLAKALPASAPNECAGCMANSILTARDHIPAAAHKQAALLIGTHLQ